MQEYVQPSIHPRRRSAGRHGRPRFAYLMLGATTLAFLSSCGRDKGTPTEPPVPLVPGTLQVQVQVDGSGVSGIAVGISGPESRSGTTDGAGSASFTGVRPGTYTVQISGFGTDAQFPSTTQTATVAAGGSAGASFSGTWVVASVAVTPALDTLRSLGDTKTLSAVALTASGRTVTKTIQWSSSDAQVATVDGSGVVTARANGAVDVRASVGSVQGTARVVVRQRATTLSVTPDTVALVVGGTGQVTVTARDARDNPVVVDTTRLAVTASSSTVATVEKAPPGVLVRAREAGNATVTVTFDGFTRAAHVSVAAIPNLGVTTVEVSGTVSLPASVNPAAAYVLSPAGGVVALRADGTFTAQASAEHVSTLLLMNGQELLALGLVTPGATPSSAGVFGASGGLPELGARSSAMAYLMLTPLFAAAPARIWPSLIATLEGLPEVSALESVIRSYQTTEGRLPGVGDTDFETALATALRAAYRGMPGSVSGGFSPSGPWAAEVKGNGIELTYAAPASGGNLAVSVRNTRARDVDLYLVPADDLGRPTVDLTSLGGSTGAVRDRALMLRPAKYVADISSLGFWWDLVTRQLDYGATNPVSVTVPFTAGRTRYLVYGYGPGFGALPIGDELYRWGQPLSRTMLFSVYLPIADAMLGIKAAKVELSGAMTAELEVTLFFFTSFLLGMDCWQKNLSVESDRLDCVMKAVVQNPDLWGRAVTTALNGLGKAGAAQMLAKNWPGYRVVNAAVKAAGLAETGIAIVRSHPRQVFDLSYNAALGAASLVKQAGDSQTGVAGSPLATDLAVRVSTTSGATAPGAWVVWTPNQGHGTVSSTQTTADNSGVARVRWSPGAVSGTQTLTARLAGHESPNVTFTATATAGNPVATITLSPTSATLAPGQTVQLTATLKDASGNTLTGRTVTWSSSSTTVATVSTTGLVTAVAVGNATISATSEGKSTTAAVTVTTGGGGGAKRIYATSSTGGGFGPGVSDLWVVTPTSEGKDTLIVRLKNLESGREPAFMDIAESPTGELWGLGSESILNSFPGLYLIDRESGRAERRYSINANYGDAATFDSRGNLYVSVGGMILMFHFPTPGRPELVLEYRHNLLIGSFADMDFSPSGELYGVFSMIFDPDKLARIDLESGKVTFIGNGSGLRGTKGIAFIGDTLFGLSYTGFSSGSLVSIDTTKGEGTKVKNLPFSPTGAASRK